MSRHRKDPAFEDEEPEEGGFHPTQRRDRPPRREREREQAVVDDHRRNTERAGESSRRQPSLTGSPEPEGGIKMDENVNPNTGVGTMISPEDAEKLKEKIGPQSPESTAAMAVRMAARATKNIKTPAERAAEEARARKVREEKQTRDNQTSGELEAIPEEAKVAFLNALKAEYTLGRKPERFLSPTEKEELQEARELVDTLKSWPPEARRPYYEGFADAKDEALRQGFEAWRRNERRTKITEFSKGTVTLHQALDQGRGKFVLWVKYPVMKREVKDGPLVQVYDGRGEPRTASGLIKIEVMGYAGRICDKLDERRPPFIHPDNPAPGKEQRKIVLDPDSGFETEQGRPFWHPVVRKALVELWAEEELEMAQAERRAEVATLTSEIECQRTITVSGLTDGLGGGKSNKTGVVAINNPGLLVDPRDRKGDRFHLAFSIRVGAKGASRMDEKWYSSYGPADLSPVVGRELVVSLQGDGFLDVNDPNLPSEDGLDGEEREAAVAAREAIANTLERIKGAFRAQKVYERNQAERAREAEKAEAAEAEGAEDTKTEEESKESLES